jgi:hypothetical protein
LFYEWKDRRKGGPIEQAKIARYGTIDWLFRQYKTEKAYTEKVSPRTRPDYERIMQMICDTVGKSGRRIGERHIGERHIVEVTPRAADKVYDRARTKPFRQTIQRVESGWGARIRTWEWRNQNPLPYHLATPHRVAWLS